MGLLDKLLTGISSHAGGGKPPPTDKVTQNASMAVIAAGLSEAMKSKDTPDFGDFVARLFDQSTPGQKAGLLNRLLGAVGPVLLSGAADGVLGRLAPGQKQLSPEQAASLTPEDAARLALHAASAKPGIVELVAQFYAQHSDVINKIGKTLLNPVVARVNEKGRE